MPVRHVFESWSGSRSSGRSSSVVWLRSIAVVSGTSPAYCTNLVTARP